MDSVDFDALEGQARERISSVYVNGIAAVIGPDLIVAN